MVQRMERATKTVVKKVAATTAKPTKQAPVPTPKRAEPVEVTLPSKIEVMRTTMVNVVVPGHVFRQAPFRWQPQPFPITYEKMENKFISEKAQDESLLRFLRNPETKGTFCIGGNPDDQQAKYMAAYLVAHHLRKVRSANVVWNPLYSDFANRMLEEQPTPPSLIVLTNLTSNSTNVKLEKARDLLEKYSDIPRIVVVAGCDPMTFMCGKLYSPVSGVIYLQAQSLKMDIL